MTDIQQQPSEAANYTTDSTSQQAHRRIRVGITQGDTNGVGWELILRTFADSELLDLLTPSSIERC